MSVTLSTAARSFTARDDSFPYNFRSFCSLFSLSFYSSSISSLHFMYVLHPFASRAHRGQTRIYSLFVIATFISTLLISLLRNLNVTVTVSVCNCAVSEYGPNGYRLICHLSGQIYRTRLGYFSFTKLSL